METLSIIAYRQPITKAEIEDIRGVSADGVINSLLEKKFIRMVGRKEVVGRPLLYGTTKDFLHYFGLKNLNDMPELKDLEEVLKTDEARENWQLDDQGELSPKINLENSGEKEEEALVEDNEISPGKAMSEEESSGQSSFEENKQEAETEVEENKQEAETEVEENKQEAETEVEENKQEAKTD